MFGIPLPAICGLVITLSIIVYTIYTFLLELSLFRFLDQSAQILGRFHSLRVARRIPFVWVWRGFGGVPGTPCRITRGTDGIWFLLAGRCHPLFKFRAVSRTEAEALVTAAWHTMVASGPQSPDSRNDCLGWRVWRWDGISLRSPYMKTEWPDDGILVAKVWPEGEFDDPSGSLGIHAAHMPASLDLADPLVSETLLPAVRACGGPYHWPERSPPFVVHGVVERWGRAVVGTAGWRAETVCIKQLYAPTAEIAAAIEKAYPSTPVAVRPPLGLIDIFC